MPVAKFQSPAEAKIRALAQSHHVSYMATKSDVFGGHVTRLAGDSVELDEPAKLILALRRGGHISRKEATKLHGDYLRAKYE